MDKIIQNASLRWWVKWIVCCLIVFAVLSAFCTNAVGKNFDYLDIEILNELVDDAQVVTASRMIKQGVIAEGNLLSNVDIYLRDVPNDLDSRLVIQIMDSQNQVLLNKEISSRDLSAGDWNSVDLSMEDLEIGEVYYLVLFSEDAGFTTCISKEVNEDPAFQTCSVGDSATPGTVVTGFHFTQAQVLWYNFIPGLIAAVSMLAALCYSVWNIEILLDTFRKTKIKHATLYAAYFSVSLLLLFNPLSNIRTTVEEFTRVIGRGVILNYDAARVINNFTVWFVYLAVSFPLFYLLVNCCKAKETDSTRLQVWAFLDNFIALANACLAFHCIAYFYEEKHQMNVFRLSAELPTLILACGVLYLLLHLERKISAKGYMQWMFCVFGLSYPVSVLVVDNWFSGEELFVIQTIFVLMTTLSIRFRREQVKTEKSETALNATTAMLCALPLLTSVYFETINVLNQYSVFVVRLRAIYAMAFVVMLAIVILAVTTMIKRRQTFTNWRSWAYPLLVFGVSCLSAQIPLESVYSSDIFESANYSVLITDFLNFGSIPLVEHYGGHMMTGVWEGLIYGILNNDFPGAAFSPYANYHITVLALLFYYLVKYLWDEDMAVWTALLFPFYGQWYYFGLGMLVVLAAVAYVKRNTYFRAFVFWLSFVWCAIYRLDLGFAFGIAGIATLLIYSVAGRNKTAWKQLSLSLACVGVFGVMLWCVLCVVRDVNPVTRLLEFLYISQSNANWAYNSIGSEGHALFPWCYLFVPFAVILSLMYTVLSRSFREKIGDSKWIILLMLGFTYLANFSRGLVRHSLYEMTTYVVLWSAYVYLATFICCLKKDGKLFVSVFAVLILCHCLSVQSSIFHERPIIDTASDKLVQQMNSWNEKDYKTEDGEKITYWEMLYEEQEPVERIQWSDGLKAVAVPIQSVTNLLLEEDETFLDFVNYSFLYSVFGRKSPVYVSQSPLQLSGEYTQEQFVAQIDANLEKIPVVLMPDCGDTLLTYALDGIANSYRYYKVAEYIYTHYVPLCRTAGITVWCLAERRADYAEKLYGADYNATVIAESEISALDCAMEADTKKKTVTLTTTGGDPRLADLQNCFDLKSYVGNEVVISVSYETNADGFMRLMYTTEPEEEFYGGKSVNAEISGKGTAQFRLTVAEDMRLCLAFPISKEVTITGLSIGMQDSLIDWGYDAVDEVIDESYVPGSDYSHNMHNYWLAQLPVVWAELEKNSPVHYETLTRPEYNGEYFLYNGEAIADKSQGNYLHFTTHFAGADTNGYYGPDDETGEAVIKLGVYEDGVFTVKYRYKVSLREGTHDYLIRISSDYFWYTEDVNAVWLDSKWDLTDTQMRIVCGD